MAAYPSRPLEGIIILSREAFLDPLHLRSRRIAVLLIAVLAICLPPSLAAHDIPADATVRMFVKAEGQRLHALLRVPMASIKDIDWPTERSGYLDHSRIEPFLRDAATLWIADYLDMYEGGTKLASPTLVSVRLSTEGDTSFATYEDALGHVTGARIPADTNLFPNQGQINVLFDYAIQSDQARFSLHPRFDHFGLRVLTILRFVSPNGTTRAFEYEGGDPGLIRLDPARHQAAWTFATMGFRDLLGGVDHLLFLFAVVLPFRRARALVAVGGAFLVAHSITLVAAAYGMAPGVSWFPPLIETLIAVSVLYVTVENVIGLGAPGHASVQRRALVAFGFGLVHGFGFSFALGPTLQFAGSHFLTSTLSFDAGVGSGEILALALLIPALNLLFRLVVPERLGTIVLSALVAHTGWHWLIGRVSLLWRYQFSWPELTPAFFADVLRWMMLAVAIAGVLWLGSLLVKSTRPSRSSTP